MPELPDVEIFRRYAESKATRKTIKKVSGDEDQVMEASARTIGRSINGHQFISTARKGKYLFMGTGNNKNVVFHFGMTGNFAYREKKSELPANTRFTIEFENGDLLGFVNQRKLGMVDLTDGIEEFCRKEEIGPDALEISQKDFIDLLKTREGSIKSALMDQSLVSGIGNIYSDEILFQAGWHPNKQVPDLSESDLEELYQKIHHVLELAIKRNADPAKLPYTWLLPNREEGKKCPRCKGKIEKIKISGRGCYICPSCQNK
ncbi:MAG: Fpg/Nei family DNA glycosylase [Bacteroidales bacterium]